MRIEGGDLHVEDAANLPPSIPFWMGEAPGRSRELSFAVSRLREEIADLCSRQSDGPKQALAWLQEVVGIDSKSAQQAVNYIAAARTTLGAMPSFDTLILERFFDESGGMQLILHSPFGNRINRAWGLALRKRFCRNFNFELQAAATENAIILSLGTSQSFELESVANYLHSATVRDILIQALLDAPMFTIRWRWNCTSALAVRRFQGGKKTPPYLLRMQCEDLISSVFPQQLACLENISGDREIPEHPLVQQSIQDCLTEAMDIDALIEILKRIESGDLRVVARDVVEPSPLAGEVLNARNYAFLDGAPAEERRTRAVLSRRWLDPQSAADLGRLDAGAIERVRSEVWPRANSADELHEALSLLAFVVEDHESLPHWTLLFEELIARKRAARFHVPHNAGVFWVACERLPLFIALYGGAHGNRSQFPGGERNMGCGEEASTSFSCDAPQCSFHAKKPPASDLATGTQSVAESTAMIPDLDRSTALTEILRGRLANTGPVRSESLSRILGIEVAEIEASLL
ncbi:MAG: ATP-dependent DNA helicase, partial [Methylococcales bacterium]